jgi:RNA polymerase sigma factor (sigma-70 family)
LKTDQNSLLFLQLTTTISKGADLTDKELVDNLLSEDQRLNSKSWNLVITWVSDVVYAKHLEERILPEEIIGDTMEKVLRNLRSNVYRFESPLKAYVQMITRYTLVDALKKWIRYREYINSLSSEPTDPENPAGIMEGNERIAITIRMFELMKETCRDLMKMILEQCFDRKTIAEKLGRSVEWVKVNVHRCKEEATSIVKKIS